MKILFCKAVLVVTLLPVIGFAQQVIPFTDADAVTTRFQSAIPPGGLGITIECTNSSRIQNVDCALWNDPKFKTPVKFLALRANQSYLTRLITESASKVESMTGVTRDFPISADDRVALKRIADGQISCFSDEKMSDLLVACPIPERDQKTTVLFLRGLCDRCEFEPIVLRAEQKK